MYENICRGLFQQHKMIFSFLIATSICKNMGLVTEESYNLLLRGTGVFDKAKQPAYSDYPHVHSIITES